MGAHGALLGDVGLAPGALEQLLLGEDAARVLGQELGDGVLGARQSQLLPVDGKGASRAIDGPPTAAQHASSSRSKGLTR